MWKNRHLFFEVRGSGSAAGESDFSRKTAVLAVTYLSEGAYSHLPQVTTPSFLALADRVFWHQVSN